MIRKFRWLILIVIVASFLRLWRLQNVPVSLFGDELDVGYHAYSILKTGRDYYGNLMPMHFHSLAEWRTPLYLYSAVPTVFLFGISPLGVRLPAALFGIMTVPLLYLLVKEIFKNEKLALLSAFLLAISPWHIQYSRAAFEVTQLVFLLVLGVYAFYRALNGAQNYLILAGASFCLMPWVYSSAKLFSPMIMLILVVLYFNKLIKFNKKVVLKTVGICLLIGLPLVYNIFYGGGAQRFSYISVFGDPTTESEVGAERLFDARARGELGEGLNPNILDRVFHNKYVFWGNNVLGNYVKSFSADFLFLNGDPNLRHSVPGMGQFYVVEMAVFMIGLIYLFSNKSINRRFRLFIGGWILFGVIPSAITVGGGDHATRLIIVLIPLLLIISYGFSKLPKLLFLIYGGLLFVNFLFYQHNYWVHYPIESERWWHYGFSEAVESIRDHDADFERIVVSTAGEPPWVFFAANYPYPPKEWQENFPIGNDVLLSGFGKVSHIDKYYFGSPQADSYWEWPSVIDSETLYLADARELNINLAIEPERIPSGLNLLKVVTYPSGEPAFYLITGQ